MNKINRQAGILVREVLLFRKANGLDDWPCVIGGGEFLSDNVQIYLIFNTDLKILILHRMILHTHCL